MLKNIKASYFIQKIFTFIDEAQKLKLIRHNKNLQMNLNISLINYKFFNFVYVIHEPNGIAKEYLGFEDMLMFEGEYLNGKRNGKGKEYDWNGKLIFEGEYLNGKRHGKGEEFSEFSFDDEYLNKKKYRKEKKICRSFFEGEFSNGLRNGKVEEYIDGKLRFKDEYLNGKRWNGEVNEYYLNCKLYFEGEYINGKKIHLQI